MSIFVRRRVSITERECPGKKEGAAKVQEDEEIKQGGLGFLLLLRANNLIDRNQYLCYQVDPGGSPDCGLCGVREHPPI